MLTGISSRAWEHPADRGALIAMRRLRGFDTILRALSSMVHERGVRLELLGSAVRVDERQFGRLHRLLVEACTTLDAPSVPAMYVVADPYLNARTLGLDRPSIVVNSALVDLLSEEELRFVIGHELGHALSGHAVYQTMLEWILSLSGLLSAIPVGGIAFRVIQSALLEWSRKAELSADRAGLLATQDPQTAFRVHMQLASGGHLEDLDTTSFFAQGASYDADGDLRESFLKVTMLAEQTHPFAVIRATELRRWVESGEYTAYLSGAYPRREDDPTASVSDAARDAARGYATAFAQTGDALGKLVHDSAGVLGTLKGWWDERWGREG
ncbi:Zn-dependent protease [Marmoricola endophyticus]|uniref:Zn-dependent protease n=1 Tax=Marmoricola endophyticus TaxID=2040280 RepID=A0A917BN18_9ACTN|nr:Zn-dependent protease [Marmoricola endophyticus]